jgi:hypothetical protein
VVTTSDSTLTAPAEARPTVATPVRRLSHPWWLPAVAVTGFVVVVLLAFETPALDVLRYAGYVAYGLVLPGTLLWRSLRGTPRSFVEDVACGTALAYAVELLVYLPCAALGVPALVAAWPAVVVIAFVAVPGLRRHWRPTGVPAMPAAWSWALAGTASTLVGWLAWSGYLSHALTGPKAGNPYIDMPYHLALAGELKHHVPPKMPQVIGEPLSYHWFGHAHLAASSWVSGVELDEILYRLHAVPLAVLTVLLVAVLAARVSGRLWAGPVAAALTVFVGLFSPYVWNWVGPPTVELNMLTLHIWASPTQNYGLVLFLPLVLLVADRLRRAPGAAGQWAMIVVLTIVTMGGKATFLPLLVCGVGLAGLIGLITRRRIDKPLLIVAALGLAAMVYAQQVLFGGVSAGMRFDPLFTSESFAKGYVPTPPTWFVLFATAMILASWAARAAGLVGLRQRWKDPVFGVLAGIVIAGLIVAFSFAQPGGGQLYFARSMAPFLAVLSAWGAAELVPPERATRRLAAALLGSALLGGAVMTAVIQLGPDAVPTGSRRSIAVALLVPYLAVVVAVAAFAAGLFVLRRGRIPALRGVSAALVVAMLLGLGVTRLVPYVRDPVRYVQANGGLAYTTIESARPIAPGGVRAGRWLRDHSDPDDRVATNTHCVRYIKGVCDNRHFWIAAYTERRMLVEGWGYAPTGNASTDGPVYVVPYWRPDVLADNDRVFTAPSAAAANRLRDRYGVRWLFVDRRFDPPAPGLDKVAKLRFESGDTAVYELR